MGQEELYRKMEWELGRYIETVQVKCKDIYGIMKKFGDFDSYSGEFEGIAQKTADTMNEIFALLEKLNDERAKIIDKI
ncbi:MAG: hypothetical protein IKU13_06965 [Clostridia bacterium]|nr:hypothetical protein [Clostridia bacterium]